MQKVLDQSGAYAVVRGRGTLTSTKTHVGIAVRTLFCCFPSWLLNFARSNTLTYISWSEYIGFYVHQLWVTSCCTSNTLPENPADPEWWHVLGAKGAQEALAINLALSAKKADAILTQSAVNVTCRMDWYCHRSCPPSSCCKWAITQVLSTAHSVPCPNQLHFCQLCKNKTSHTHNCTFNRFLEVSFYY